MRAVHGPVRPDGAVEVTAGSDGEGWAGGTPPTGSTAAEDRVAAYVARLLEAAPRLTCEQQTDLRRLLGPAPTSS